MAVTLKRSNKTGLIPNECPYGCCTEMYGRNIPNIRRSVKRSDNQRFRKDLRNGSYGI